MAHATALCCVEGGRVEWANQNALRFDGRIGYDDRYNGVALDAAEGDRMCAALAENTILFLANHGVIVTGVDVATAFDDLYYLERTCQQQILAQSTGLPLKIIPDEVRDRVRRQIPNVLVTQAHLHFDALNRRLDRQAPDSAS